MTTTSRYVAREPQLTDDQLTTLRALLAEALADHRAQFEEHEALANSLTADTDDDVGRGREAAHVAATRAREAMAEVERALARMDEGTYGRCEACELPIPFERLEVIPESRYCLACSNRGGLVA